MNGNTNIDPALLKLREALLSNVTQTPMQRLRAAMMAKMQPVPSETPMQRLRLAMRRASGMAPPAHLCDAATLRSRNLTRLEWKLLCSNSYPRIELAEYFWPGLPAWLNNTDNATEFFLTGCVDEARHDDETTSAWFQLTGHFPDVETAVLFKLRWL